MRVAVPTGLEPVTFGLGNRCSIRLSYGTNLNFSYLAQEPKKMAQFWLCIVWIRIRWRSAQTTSHLLISLSKICTYSIYDAPWLNEVSNRVAKGDECSS